MYISLLHMVMLYDYYIKYYTPLLMHHYRQAVSFRDGRSRKREMVVKLRNHPPLTSYQTHRPVWQICVLASVWKVLKRRTYLIDSFNVLNNPVSLPQDILCLFLQISAKRKTGPNHPALLAIFNTLEFSSC